MDELKPCPFCGSTASIHEVPVNTITRFEVNCDKCFASMDHYYHQKEKAIEAWNART